LQSNEKKPRNQIAGQKKEIAVMTMPDDEPNRNINQQKSDAELGIVAEWPISAGQVLRISVEPYKGAWLFNVRKWFDPGNGELRPSKQGVALSVKHLPKLAEAVNGALSAARSRGLVAGSGQ
jgi:hypothetical protein